MIVTITLIELKSPLKYLALVSHYLKIMQQAKNASCVSLKSTGFWTTFYTMTLWESLEDMKIFARKGAHLDAMKVSGKIAKEIRTLTMESPILLSWKEAKQKVKSEGKIMQY